jgi:uncharacterized protein YndB with AHSA1/START domain
MNRRQRRRRAAMKRALLVSPPLLAALVWIAGSLSSPEFSERTTATFPATPETVWRVLVDLDGMPQWRQDLSGVERLPDLDGAVRWREIGLGGRAADFERVEAVAPTRLVVRPLAGSWRRTYRLERGMTGTTVAITEERRIENPLLRAYVVVFGVDRRELQSLSRDLGRRLAGRREQLAGVTGR